MPFDVPHFRPPPLPEPTPVVRLVQRADAPWNRSMFKAPPLEVYQLLAAANPFEQFRPLDAPAS